MSLFERAQRRKAKLKIGMAGVSGSGKTYSALLLAKGLVLPPYEGKVAVLDTENRSAELYSDLFPYDVAVIKAPFTTEKYVELILAAEAAGYEVVIIDSLTHAWSAEGGILDQQSAWAAREKNPYTAWRHVTPKHNKLVDTMLQANCHIIATIRSKAAYEIVKADGRSVPQKIGMAPIQREGMDYEFTLMFDIDREGHVAFASKNRTSEFKDKEMFTISEDTGRRIREWYLSGAGDEVMSELTSSPGEEPKEVFKTPEPAEKKPKKKPEEETLEQKIQKLFEEYLDTGMKSLDIKKTWEKLTGKTTTKDYTQADLDMLNVHLITTNEVGKTDILLSSDREVIENDNREINTSADAS